MHMLRAVVDDAAFGKGLKQFVSQYAWKRPTTDDFRKVFETAQRPEARLLLPSVDRIERRAGVQAGLHRLPYLEGLPGDG